MRSFSLLLSIRRTFHRPSCFSYWKSSPLEPLLPWSFHCWSFPRLRRSTLKIEWTTAFPISNKCKNGWYKRFSVPIKHMLKYIWLERRPLNRWYDRPWMRYHLDGMKLVSNHLDISSISSTGNDITWSIWPCKVSLRVHLHTAWRELSCFSLSFEEQDDLISSLMFHVCSLSLMVKQCSINEYHGHFVKELEVHLLQVTDCQSKVVLALTTFPSPDRTVLSGYRTDLEQALSSLRKAYISARLRRIEHVLGSGKTIQSDDHLSHAFFLFQLAAIVRLLTRATTVASDRSVLQEIRDALKGKKGKKRRTIKQWLKPQWPRVLSAIKSMVIIGVGSIFVMVPRLAKAFENGQWILIALCMTQGDTVGGALTTMKMRLIGTLLGIISFNFLLEARSTFFRRDVGLCDLHSCWRSCLSHIGHACAVDTAVRIFKTITALELCSHRCCLHTYSDQPRSYPIRECGSGRWLRPSSNRRESGRNRHCDFSDHCHLSGIRHWRTEEQYSK